jgi:hypothetical protein
MIKIRRTKIKKKYYKLELKGETKNNESFIKVSRKKIKVKKQYIIMISFVCISFDLHYLLHAWF